MGILCGQRLGSFSECGVQPPPPIQPVATATTTATAASATTTSSSISSSSTSSIHSSSSSSSSIQFLGDVPIRSTSHTDPATGLAIRKQQLIEPFAVPNLAGISVATLVPRQTVELHDHRSMHEFFYVLEGTADVWVCGNVVNQNENEDQNEGQQWHRVGSGSLVHVAPNCVHSITVPETANTDLKMLVIGLTVGD